MACPFRLAYTDLVKGCAFLPHVQDCLRNLGQTKYKFLLETDVTAGLAAQRLETQCDKTRYWRMEDGGQSERTVTERVSEYYVLYYTLVQLGHPEKSVTAEQFSDTHGWHGLFIRILD